MAFDHDLRSKWLDFSPENAARTSWIEWRCITGEDMPVINVDWLHDTDSQPVPPLEVRLEGVIVSCDPGAGEVGLLDRTGFQLLKVTANQVHLQPGAHVRLTGELHYDEERVAVVKNPTFVQLGMIPENRAVKSEQSVSTSRDFLRTSVSGRVLSVAEGSRNSVLRVAIDAIARPVHVNVVNPGHVSLVQFLDQHISVSGVAESRVDAKGKMAIGGIWVSSPDAIRVEKSAKDGLSQTTESEIQAQVSTRTITPIGRLYQIMKTRPVKPVEVKIRGVITYIDLDLTRFFLQDGADSIEVNDSLEAGLYPLLNEEGNYVEFPARLEDNVVHARSFATVLGKAQMPLAVRRNLEALLAGEDDGRRVEVEGIVSSYDRQPMTLIVHGKNLNVWINRIDKGVQKRLLGSLVQVRGVCAPVVNARNQRVGVRLLVPSSEDIAVVRPAPEDPFDLPVTPLGDLMRLNPFDTKMSTHFVKTAGVLTYIESHVLFVQDGNQGVRIFNREETDARPGDWVEVVGLAQPDGFSPKLVEARVRRVRRGVMPPASHLDLFSSNADLNADDQDAIRGQLDAIFLGESVTESAWVLELQHPESKTTFSAFLPIGVGALPSIPVGSKVRLEGVFKAKTDAMVDFGQVITSFEMYLPSPLAITILQRPPWWTTRRTIWILAVVAAVMLVSLAWVTLLRSQVRQRTRALHEEIEDHKQTEDQLKAEIEERKRMEVEVAKQHEELVIASREAGMAEIAVSVLHNVGNVLNSINVSVNLLSEQWRKSKLANVGRVAAMIREHSDNLGEFLTQDPKGRQIPGYLSQLSDYLTEEHTHALKEMDGLLKSMEHIKEIVVMQQNYSKVRGIVEHVKPADLVADALRMNGDSLKRRQIAVTELHTPGIPDILVEKHKVLQILVNLIRNAQYACEETGKPDRHLSISTSSVDHSVAIRVEDNGVGISPENMTRIFSYGFTTRKQGHGFGLHSCALAAKELGGALRAESPGPGQGAAFILELPLDLSSVKAA